MVKRPLKVAWISVFPIEWLSEIPEPLRLLPREHPAPWLQVLLGELEQAPEVKLHVFSVRKHFQRSCRFERRGVTFHCVKVPGGLRAPSLFWWETLLLRRALKEVQPDLVHAWGTERGAALVASRLGYPYLVTMQGLLEWILQYVKAGPLARFEGRVERVSLQRASVVTAESSFAVQWLREHYPHLEVRQIEHAPNWLFHRVKRQPQTRPLQFLHVSALSLLKGADLLLRALDRLRNELDFHLTLVGLAAPEQVAGLKVATSPALWDRITLRQNLTPAELAEEMARATMMLFPTRVDNSPNSVKEAVVAGLPVVASAVGGILDYVRPGQNGVRFTAGNLEEFIQAIRTAVAHPLFGQGQVEPQTLQEMREYLSPKTMSQKFLAAYQRQAGAQPSVRS
jgi:glycosyltransferase involved in cell wall biosynthesis